MERSNEKPVVSVEELELAFMQMLREIDEVTLGVTEETIGAPPANVAA